VYKERDGVVGKDDMKKPYKIVPTILKPPHIFFGTLAEKKWPYAEQVFFYKGGIIAFLGHL
jgi:hypothetical protein